MLHCRMERFLGLNGDVITGFGCSCLLLWGSATPPCGGHSRHRMEVWGSGPSAVVIKG